MLFPGTVKLLCCRFLWPRFSLQRIDWQRLHKGSGQNVFGTGWFYSRCGESLMFTQIVWSFDSYCLLNSNCSAKPAFFFYIIYIFVIFHFLFYFRLDYRMKSSSHWTKPTTASTLPSTPLPVTWIILLSKTLQNSTIRSCRAEDDSFPWKWCTLQIV